MTRTWTCSLDGQSFGGISGLFRRCLLFAVQEDSYAQAEREVCQSWTSEALSGLAASATSSPHSLSEEPNRRTALFTSNCTFEAALRCA
jgi:hypothetical protein